MTKYDELIAQGVPPDLAAQTIYDQITRTPVPREALVPKAEPFVPNPKGKPIQLDSQTRVLGGMMLVAAYGTKSGSTLTLSMAAINRLMEKAQPGVLQLPSVSALANLVSRLRTGKISGFPKMDIEGPLMRTYDRQYQPIVVIASRNRDNDLLTDLVDPAKVPVWALKD